MANDQNLEKLAKALLSKSAENPWLIPSIVNPALQKEVILYMLKNWSLHNSKEKLAIFFLILCVKKSTVTALQELLSEILLAGASDLDDCWVCVFSKMMINYPKTGELDLTVENYLPREIQQQFNELINKIMKSEIRLHPMEFAFIDKDISKMRDFKRTAIKYIKKFGCS
nr:79_t:CDS:2 [Entrophospora candida]